MSDEATRRNILAIKQHSESTRELFRELEKKCATIETLRLDVEMLKSQIQLLQVKLYSGGST